MANKWVMAGIGLGVPMLVAMLVWAASMDEHKRTAEEILDSLEKRQQKIETDKKVESVCDWAWKRCVEKGVRPEDCDLPKECR